MVVAARPGQDSHSFAYQVILAPVPIEFINSFFEDLHLLAFVCLVDAFPSCLGCIGSFLTIPANGILNTFTLNPIVPLTAL